MTVRKKMKRRAVSSKYNAAHIESLRAGIPYPDAPSLHANPNSQNVIPNLEYGDLDRDACASAWRELGFQVLAEHLIRYPGTRPWGFWIFERNEPMPETPVGELARLVELNDLTIEEDAELRRLIAERPHLDGRDQLLAILDGETLSENELDELYWAFDGLKLVPDGAHTND
jgi:hypothetical protein